MGRARLTPTLLCESYDLSIDHRSLEAQGIDRVPQMHLGVHALAMEERGLETERGDRFGEIEELNKGYELERRALFLLLTVVLSAATGATTFAVFLWLYYRGVITLGQ